MEDVERLLSQAYQAHVLEEDDQVAIGLCRQALSVDPSSYPAHVLLGMLLGDQSGEQEKMEAREHFSQAIKLAANIDIISTTWPEEAVVYHLGLWEWKHGNICSACIFFLLDYMISHNKESFRHLTELMAESNPSALTDLRLILNHINQKR